MEGFDYFSSIVVSPDKLTELADPCINRRVVRFHMRDDADLSLRDNEFWVVKPGASSSLFFVQLVKIRNLITESRKSN